MFLLVVTLKRWLGFGHELYTQQARKVVKGVGHAHKCA
jgi:hypothetical protein